MDNEKEKKINELKGIQKDLTEEKQMLETLRAERSDLQAEVAALRVSKTNLDRKLKYIFFLHLPLHFRIKIIKDSRRSHISYKECTVYNDCMTCFINYIIY